jgi:hypothetical protein
MIEYILHHIEVPSVGRADARFLVADQAGAQLKAQGGVYRSAPGDMHSQLQVSLDTTANT